MEEAINKILKLNIKSRNDLMLAKRKIAKEHNISIPKNSIILKYYQKGIKNKLIKPNPGLFIILRKRAIRTLSGIAPVAVLTKPYSCPGKCAYCPTEKDVPQSYLSNEPAVMRAIRCKYNPYVQVQDRLRALEANGHCPTKIELIVIGGTWSYLPKKYKYWYIGECFRAANDYNYQIPNSKRISGLSGVLKKEQRRNEKAKYKIIGITLETRPDFINEKELLEMRELGCTRVEMGVQAVDDKILKFNKRGHGVKEIVDATKLLKNYGFKVTYHIMPGLPGSTAAKDLRMFKSLFNDERFQPDQLKFYPTVVTKGSLLYRWWKQGKYRPYSDKALKNLIIKCKQCVPAYVRIIRLIRDIPGESIIAGNRVTNLRQVVQNEGVDCKCIRCREIKGFPISDFRLSIEKYKASSGEEFFISFVSKDKKRLYGFCRLRLAGEKSSCKGSESPFGALRTTSCVALVRELHVYGELVPVGGKKRVQHSGLGKKLLFEAERIAKENNYHKIAVISGVGVRDYYRKLGYRLEKTYVVKNLTKYVTIAAIRVTFWLSFSCDMVGRLFKK